MKVRRWPRRRKITAALVAALVLALALAAPAFGSTVEVGPKPEVVKMTSLSEEGGLVVKCWKDPWWFAAVRRSSVGIKVWKYGMTVDDFCWNGRRIVLIHTHRCGCGAGRTRPSTRTRACERGAQAMGA